MSLLGEKIKQRNARQHERRGDELMSDERPEEARAFYEKSGSRYAQAKIPASYITEVRQKIERGLAFDIATLDDAKKAHFAIIDLLSSTVNELKTYDGILMSSLDKSDRINQENLVGQASELTILTLFSRNFVKNEDIIAVPADIKNDFRNGKKAYDLAVFSIYSPYEAVPVQIKTNARSDHRKYYHQDIALIGAENVCAAAGVSLREIQERLIEERHGLANRNDEVLDGVFQNIIEKISQTDTEYERKMRLGKLSCNGSAINKLNKVG